MLALGRMNKLTVDYIADESACLGSDKGDVLLPVKDLPAHAKVGDTLDVFVYCDQNRQLLATTTRPLAEVGDIATLTVTDVNDYGAFLDWGMEKDLLLPYRRQVKRVVPGQKCIVRLLLDETTSRVIATTRLRLFLRQSDSSLRTGQEVTALFFDKSEVGLSAVVNGTYHAMLHMEEATSRIEFGVPRPAYIKRLLPEGQIDLALRKVGTEAVTESRHQLLTALERAGGFLPYTDKSSPEDIRQHFGMSKKAFKKGIGALYKAKKITLEDNGIRLLT